jgi:hypothetical protein
MPASLAILMMAAARFFTVLESPNVVKEKATVGAVLGVVAVVVERVAGVLEGLLGRGGMRSSAVLEAR